MSHPLTKGSNMAAKASIKGGVRQARNLVSLPRAARSFVLSFGLFNVPVAWAPLFSSDDGIKGHKHCPDHHGRVSQAWYCEHGDHYVESVALETAYDYDGHSITLGDSELAALEADRDGVVKLRKSVQADTIDPSYFEKAYLIWPKSGPTNEQAYLALLTAMRNTGMALIGQVVVSKTDRMLVIRWSDEHGCLVAHVCNFDLSLKHDAVAMLQDAIDAWAQPSSEFVDQAELMLKSLEGDFDAAMVEDTYQVRLAEKLYQVASGQVVEDDEEAEPVEVPDLLTALKAEIAAGKEA